MDVFFFCRKRHFDVEAKCGTVISEIKKSVLDMMFMMFSRFFYF